MSSLTSISYLHMEPLERRRYLAATLGWVLGAGSIDYDSGNLVAAHPAGGAYIAGTIGAAADFQPGSGITTVGCAGETDIYIARYSARGKLLWARGIGGSSYDSTSAMAADSAGNLLLAGRFSGTVDFDPGPGITRMRSAGGVDSFLIKLSPEGSLIWAGQVGGLGGGTINAIAVDAAGNPIIAGEFSGSFDVNPARGQFLLTSRGDSDAFVARLSVNGKLLWAGTMGSSDADDDDYIGDSAEALAVDPSGQIYLAGRFSGKADLDPAADRTQLATSAGSRDLFVSSLTSDGALRWAKRIGGTDVDQPYDLAVYGDRVYVSGDFNRAVDFDPGDGRAVMTARKGYRSDFVMSLSAADGSYGWAKMFYFGGTHRTSLAAGAGGVYVTGDFYQTVDFDPGPGTLLLQSSPGFKIYGGRMDSWDAFILHLSSNGRLIDATRFGYKGWDAGKDIALSAAGKVLLVGDFGETVDFDPGPAARRLTSLDLSDIFLLELLI